jgi:predicted RNase H-like nuclease (RuvC/YqgF family)
MLNNISTNKRIIYSIIALVAIIGFYFITTSTPGYVEKYEKIIDSAQTQIDSLSLEIEKSDIIIDSLHKEIEVLDSTNYTLRERIYYIRKENEEKINTVDHYNVSDLNKFFTDRYPQN